MLWPAAVAQGFSARPVTGRGHGVNGALNGGPDSRMVDRRHASARCRGCGRKIRRCGPAPVEMTSPSQPGLSFRISLSDGRSMPGSCMEGLRCGCTEITQATSERRHRPIISSKVKNRRTVPFRSSQSLVTQWHFDLRRRASGAGESLRQICRHHLPEQMLAHRRAHLQFAPRRSREHACWSYDSRTGKGAVCRKWVQFGARRPAANLPGRKRGHLRRLADPLSRTSSSFAENKDSVFRMLCGERQA